MMTRMIKLDHTNNSNNIHHMVVEADGAVMDLHPLRGIIKDHMDMVHLLVMVLDQVRRHIPHPCRHSINKDRHLRTCITIQAPGDLVVIIV
jgi:hypothetical protein